MDVATREEIVFGLDAAFGRARDVTPAPGQPLHILLARLELPEPWEPSPTRALTIWASWPGGRPDFFIDYAVRGADGEPPRSHSDAFHLGEAWRAFSFQFPWSGDDPVLAVQRWLTRFDKELPQ
jgi:hypothetical protein